MESIEIIKSINDDDQAVTRWQYNLQKFFND